MLASHFEHLAPAHVTVHIVCAIKFIIIVVTVAAVSSLLWQNIEKGFELSVKAVAVSLFDEAMGCSSPALFGVSLGLSRLFLDLREAPQSLL